MANDWKKLMDDEIEILKQGRDELKVQVHLGAAEVRDAWDKVEHKWSHLEARLKRIGQAGQESADEIEDAAKRLVDEIKASYQHIRDVL